jgi:osmoprotectant transport system permease protein
VSALSGFLSFLGERRSELLTLTLQHLVLVALATGIAILLGFPLGLLLTRSKRLAAPVLAAAALIQTVPSLALFGFLIPIPLLGGIGARTAVVALVLYALLPILRNTYEGIRGVDPSILEAATGLGMTDRERLRIVEIPLALPTILAGVRIAAVVSVGTATIAAAIGAGGLGTYVFRGLATLDSRLILAGALPSAAMALFVDFLLGRVERNPRGAGAAVLAAAAAGALAAVLLAHGHARERRIVVGSKNFTEQVLLGEIVAEALESRGFAVDRRLNLGGTSICHEALVSGSLDVYVEYSGTALLDVLKKPRAESRDAVLETVREGYRSLGVVVGPSLGFSDTFALVVSGPSARRGLRRISDLVPLARTLRVGLFGEFLERADGLPALERAYGFELTVPPREMDLGLLYQSLTQGSVDVVVGNSTDGLIHRLELAVLDDDRHFFPPYDALVLASERTLARTPGLRSALDSLQGRISEDAMRAMNDRVDGEHASPTAVARDFLSTGPGAEAARN